MKAANDLNLSPKECLVVEDAPNGIEAGKRAGARCLGLTTSFSKEDLSNADWIFSSLADVTEDVFNW